MLFTPQIKTVLLVAGAATALVACKPADNAAAPETAPATVETPAIAPDASAPGATMGAWASLDTMVGQYPRDSGLLTSSPIVNDLKVLLGNKYDTFVANMGTQAPLARDGELLFTSGNKPHEGGTEASYLIIDPAKNVLEAGLWEAGKLTTYTTTGATVRKPTDIQTMISNAQG